MKEIRKDLMGKTVMIVDDDPDLAAIMGEQLDAIGMNVVGIAGDGFAALEMIDKVDPSLIILDIVMPGMDGIELAQRINSTEPRPILFLSAYRDASYIRKAKQVGVFTYLVKPVSIDNMIPSIILTLDRFNEMSSLKATLEDMKETIANSELMVKARNILVRRKNMSDKEAYEEIQNRSYDEKKPIADIAYEIVAGDK